MNLLRRAGVAWKRRGRTLARLGAKLLLRFVPTEQQRLFALTLVIGAACGLAAVAFHAAIRATERALVGRALAAPGHTWIAWLAVTPALGGLVAGLLLQYVVPNARG